MSSRRPAVEPPAVSGTPSSIAERMSKSRSTETAPEGPTAPRGGGLHAPSSSPPSSRAATVLMGKPRSNVSMRSNVSVPPGLPKRDTPSSSPVVHIYNAFSSTTTYTSPPPAPAPAPAPAPDLNTNDDDVDVDWVSIAAPDGDSSAVLQHIPRADKASRILGIQHRRSMEPIPASTRTSIVSTRSARDPPVIPSFTPSLPLTSLYVVSGLPKSPHTWTLADPDAVLGLHHSEGAVSRWWRPEVLGSTVSPGAGGGKKKRKGNKGEYETLKGAGALSKQEVGKMLSKALKLSFTREVEIIASTLQPASTIHTFNFTLPAPSTPLAPTPSGDLLRASVLTANTGDLRSSAATFAYPYADDPFAAARPSSAYLGPPGALSLNPSRQGNGLSQGSAAAAADASTSASSTVTYHGVCLTVWSHADAERSAAIRRTLEAGRSRKESAQSLVTARLKNLRVDAGAAGGADSASGHARKKSTPKSARGPWTDGETDAETEGEGAMSESDFEVASTVGHGPGESTLFLPGDTVFWLPYALTLVSRHPIYDLMRDYLTLSWARFSKDVQSHTLQISKILSHPAPRAGDLIKLDASAKGADAGETSLEVIARFPGGLDFGRGLVDINFTMWPLFKCLNIDNVLTICEIALAPTGRILFFSRHPAILGIAVMTIKYLVELRGWNGIALPSVHSRDAKIYIDDPGPWILGLATEARYSVRPGPEVCICDLDINYLSCPSPPPGVVSVKQQRERFRQRLLSAFEPHYHPDHCVPSEFKEAFPAGRFRPVCKIQAKRGASSAAVADTIKAPEWWHSTRIIQAFDSVLQDRFKRPSLLKRISSLGLPRRPPRLTEAEQLIQLSIRKRATAFVDARDDLETKIGRLSRRLNFLMTESDLWRDKFVTFEQYAEKLSAEANQLRTKINKEQKETKRLSGLVSLTAAEKAKLTNQLKETEAAHKDALVELERMKETMDRMENERADMVAEVEAQIERALASMAVDVDESTYSASRPGSRLSSRSAPASRSRGASDATTRSARAMRSYGTESTLAESLDGVREDLIGLAGGKPERGTGTIEEEEPEEEEEEEPVSPTKKKRFSATAQSEQPQDGMSAVDEGISQTSDRIAQKVFQIQQKLETALSAEARIQKWKRGYSAHESESELSESASQPLSPRSGHFKASPSSKTRERSGTDSTTRQSDTGTISPRERPQHLPNIPSEPRTPTQSTRGSASFDSPREREGRTTPSMRSPLQIPAAADLAPPASPSALTPSTPALTSGGVSITTDDSDTDFQSAYSTSPRGSSGSLDSHDHKPYGLRADDGPAVDEEDQSDHYDTVRYAVSNFQKNGRRDHISNTLAIPNKSQPSPTLSEDTVISRGRTLVRGLSDN